MFRDINQQAIENINFRKVIYTGENSQLVLMNIAIGQEIGEEVHEKVDQILIFAKGKAESILDGVSEVVGEGDLVFVPAGTIHNFINKGDVDLKLYTIYSPPNHPEETIHKTKEDAEKAEPEY